MRTELLTVGVYLSWALNGAVFGNRYSCFTGLGVAFVAGVVGLVLGVFVTIGHSELSGRCRQLSARRSCLGAVMVWAEGFSFVAAYTALLIGPTVILVMTRPHTPG